MTDPRQVDGYVDHIFLGRVEESFPSFRSPVGTPYTDHRVRLEGRALKGNPGTVVTVRQMGGTVGEDTWTLDDHLMLEVGQRYLLTASNKPDAAALTLPAGPLSVQPVSSAADAQAKAAAWRTAIEHQRYRTTSGRRSAKPAGWHPSHCPASRTVSTRAWSPSVGRRTVRLTGISSIH
ncbi:MAG: hypothetical protein M3P91_11035 [Actinomycetota bacterium]|nr:hypothetical protein [Actinomycetota bacterium]